MWLRHISLALLLLLTLGSTSVLVKPNFLFTQSFSQDLRSQKDRLNSEFKLMEPLNLTPKQKQTLRAIYYQHKNRIIQRKQAVRQATKELRDLMVSTASSDEVRAKYQEVEAIRQELEASSFESMLAMREVLTPAQRSQFAQLMEQRAKRADNRIVQQQEE